MNKIDKINKLLKEVNYLKKSETLFNYKNSDEYFTDQNYKVYIINMYILIRIYDKEYKKFKKEHEHIGMQEYYLFIESLNLPNKMDELYTKMPEIIKENRILSYATDIPSFTSMIKK